MDAIEFQRRAIPSAAILVVLLFTVGLVYNATRKPPPVDALNGIYRNPCCPPVTLRDGVISSAGQSTRYTVEHGKYGPAIDVPEGIEIRDGKVIFRGYAMNISFFGPNSIDEAGMMHIPTAQGVLLFKKS